MVDLKKKYDNWVVVFSEGARFLGKCDVQIVQGSWVDLCPCFQMYHQVHLIQRPGAPPGVAFMPVMFPIDMCSHIDTAHVRVRLDTFFEVAELHEDDIATYDEMVTACVAQSKEKVARLREARSGIKMPNVVEVQSFGQKRD